MSLKIVIKDDFLGNPLKRRSVALGADLNNAWDSVEGDFYDYVESEIRLDVASINRHFSTLVGEDIYLTGSNQCTFNFYLDHGDDPVFVHHDEVDYIALIYLNETYRPHDGVTLYRHKATGAVHRNEMAFGTTKASENSARDENYNFDSWEPYLFMAAKFNRLIMFEALYYHAASPGFGVDKETARLCQVMHFLRREGSQVSE